MTGILFLIAAQSEGIDSGRIEARGANETGEQEGQEGHASHGVNDAPELGSPKHHGNGQEGSPDADPSVDVHGIEATTVDEIGEIPWTGEIEVSVLKEQIDERPDDEHGFEDLRRAPSQGEGSRHKDDAENECRKVPKTRHLNGGGDVVAPEGLKRQGTSESPETCHDEGDGDTPDCTHAGSGRRKREDGGHDDGKNNDEVSDLTDMRPRISERT